MSRIIFILLILSAAGSVYADDSSKFRRQEIKFISELYSGGRYFDCIAETGKLQITENNPIIEYFVYSNYFLAGQYSTVISNYKPDTSGGEYQFQSHLLLSGSYFKRGMYLESYNILKKLEYDEIPGKYTFTMFLRRVEPLIISGETELLDREIKESELLLEDKYDYIQLRQELQLYNKDGLKTPAYAALMSAVVPGLGQLYAGYPGEGFISLLSIAATAAGGIYMRENGRRSFSYTMFFFSGLFYGGNIYGAYRSAESVNEEVLHNRHRDLTSKYGSYNPGIYIDIERVFN